MINKAGMHIHKMRLKVLSPIFIGGDSGKDLGKLDYAFDRTNKIVYVIDQNKWIKYLIKNKRLEDFLSAAENKSGRIYLFEWLSAMWKDGKLKESPRNILPILSKYSYSTADIDTNQMNDIKRFVRGIDDKPYIPGSSIKGAIRTAILSSYLKANKSEFISDYENIDDDIRHSRSYRRDVARTTRDIEGLLSDGKINHNGKNAVIKGMSGLSISDSSSFGSDKIALRKKVDIVYSVDGNGENTISVFREYAMPGTEVDFSIRIDPLYFQYVKGVEALDDILKALGTNFITLYGNKTGIKATAPGIYNYLPKDALTGNNNGLMFIGGGAGYHTKTYTAALAPDREKAMETTRQLLDKSFHGKKHHADRPIAPRTVKVASVEGSDMVIGMCRISEV